MIHEACAERVMLALPKDDYLAAREYVDGRGECFCTVDAPFAEPAS